MPRQHGPALMMTDGRWHRARDPGGQRTHWQLLWDTIQHSQPQKTRRKYENEFILRELSLPGMRPGDFSKGLKFA